MLNISNDKRNCNFLCQTIVEIIQGIHLLPRFLSQSLSIIALPQRVLLRTLLGNDNFSDKNNRMQAAAN